MTQLLERAVSELNKLPARDQDAMASIILDEIEDERRWDAAFAGSHDVLARMAADVRREIQAGEVTEAGFDDL